MSQPDIGIGRLIYQLPMPLCEMFMKEVFGGKLPESLDDETLNTINKFFDNNLNISETSRQLFCTEIRWYTDWRRFRKAQTWIFVSLTMR